MLFSPPAVGSQQRAANEIHRPKNRKRQEDMKKIGLTHHPKRKPNGITKADREAMKSDDLLKRDFRSDEPLKNALRILQRLKQKMESSTLPSYSTASI